MPRFAKIETDHFHRRTPVSVDYLDHAEFCATKNRSVPIVSRGSATAI
jgi:hypothetical protein